MELTEKHKVAAAGAAGNKGRAHRTHHELVSVSWTLQSAYQNYSNEGCAFSKPLCLSVCAEKTMKKKEKRKRSGWISASVLYYTGRFEVHHAQFSLYHLIRDFFLSFRSSDFYHSAQCAEFSSPLDDVDDTSVLWKHTATKSQRHRNLISRVVRTAVNYRTTRNEVSRNCPRDKQRDRGRSPSAIFLAN